MNKKYEFIKKLGDGGFGSVYSAVKKSDRTKVAIKCVEKNKISKWSIYKNKKIPLELKIFHSLQKVPGVIRLITFHQTGDCVYYVMEHNEHFCDLFDHTPNKEGFKEHQVRNMFNQLLKIITACHNEGIVHRDIKDENILINKETDKLTLIDFGSSAIIKEDFFTDYSGTRVYAPPEWILHAKYKWESLTVWSLGILLFSLTTGDIPFESDTEICQGELNFPKNMSKECEDLIRNCLHLDQKKRFNMKKISEHRWLQCTQN